MIPDMAAVAGNYMAFLVVAMQLDDRYLTWLPVDFDDPFGVALATGQSPPG